MADYKDIFNDTLGKLAGKVKEAADTSGVLDVYAQGANRARAFGQIAKLIKRVYAEIGRLYFEQAKAAPEGFFVPLFDQADRVAGKIRDKRARIDALREDAGIAGEPDIEVEIGDFDEVVSATEADGASVDNDNR